MTWEELYKIFQSDFRTNFFSASMTLTGFLFAVKTFIVIKMKEDIFSQDFYKKRVEKARKRSPKKDIPRYKPLKNLSRFLFYSMSSSLISAILQLSVGLIDNSWASLVCIIAFVASLIFIGISMYLVKANFDVWFEELEKNDTQEGEDE